MQGVKNGTYHGGFMMHPRAFKDLRAAVDALSLDASARDVLEALVAWVGRHQRALSEPPFSEYGFDLIIRMVGRVDCYRPADLDARAAERIKHRVAGMTRGKSSSIAMFVRDLMEELLAPEVDWDCPRCGQEFGLLFGCAETPALVIMCRVCGAARFADGSALSGRRMRYIEASEVPGFEGVRT